MPIGGIVVMTGAEIAGIISAVGAAAGALLSGAALVIGAINNRAIKDVHTTTNGMSMRLNQVTGESEHAKGVKEGEKTTGDARYAEGVMQGEENTRRRPE